MVSGRNGVSFPTGPAALWWAVGLEVDPERVYVYLHMGMPECVRDWVVFTVIWVEGTGPTLSREQRADCAADSGLNGLSWL